MGPAVTKMEREEFLAYGRLPVVHRRIKHSLNLIQEWRGRCAKPYLAWSTGKDSTVALWLARQVDPDIEVIYFDADAALPDTKALIEKLVPEWRLNFRAVKCRPMLDVLAEYGVTNPHVEHQTMKATVYEPIARLRQEGYDGVIVGIRGEESGGRKRAVSKYGEVFLSKASGMLTCWPLAQWSKRDIWGAIAAHDIPYNAAYDKTRFCPREDIRVSYWCGETARTCGRWVWLKYYYPGLFNELAKRCPEAGHYV